MLYLPNYTSAKIAEEKIRYATYNCMDIDTDMNLWEDWDQLNHHSNIGDSSTISLTICDIHLNIFDGKWRCCRTQIKTEGELGGNVGNWKMWETGNLVKMGGIGKWEKWGKVEYFENIVDTYALPVCQTNLCDFIDKSVMMLSAIV